LPLAIVPDRFRSTWQNAAAKDYAARAKKRSNAIVSVVDCGAFDALVLGGSEACTTFVPDSIGGTIVRWIDARPGGDDPVLRALAGVPDKAWKPSGEIELADGRLALFPADGSYGKSSPFGPLGEENHPFGWVPVIVKPGTYTLEIVAKHTQHGVTLQLVRLRAKGSAPAKIDAPPPAPPEPKPPAKKKKGESHDAYVARLLADAPLSSATKALIDELRAPAVIMRTIKGKPGLGASKVGGDPDLPPGTKWPSGTSGPFSFVAQIDLSTIAKHAPLLPKRGLLAFFVDESADETYLSKGAVLHVTGKLAPTKPPPSFRRMAAGELLAHGHAACAVAFEPARRLVHPSNQILKQAKWGPGEKDMYADICNAAMESDRHQVLGWRDLSYDGEQSPADALLFQCFSDDRADMEWGDVDQLYFYVPRAALSKGEFTRVAVCCGE
jgi:hypothetical protein